MTTISMFQNVFAAKKPVDVGVDVFLGLVRGGTYKTDVEAIRKWVGKDDKKVAKLKEDLVCAAVAGTFTRRSAAGLQEHSGLIALDIDKIPEPEFTETRKKVNSDPFTFASFVSVSGNGLAVIVRIPAAKNKDDHTATFKALEKYYKEKLGLVVDKSCKDVARVRYISYDPDLFENHEATVFQLKVEPSGKYKSPGRRGRPRQSDDNHTVAQAIIKTGKVIGDDSYNDWVRLGFAVAAEFGECGRMYFHALSKPSSKYDFDAAEKQYSKCLKSGNQSVKFATLIYQARTTGWESEVDDKVVFRAKKRADRQMDDAPVIPETSATPETPPGGAADTPVIDAEKKPKQKKQEKDKDDLIPAVDVALTYLLNNHKLRWNQLSRRLEDDGREISDRALNSLCIDVKRIDKRIKTSQVHEIVFSDKIPAYHPLREFISERKDRPYDNTFPLISKLAACLDSDSGINDDGADLNYVEDFIKKWGCGMIAAIYGQHSPLVLVLCGTKQNSGKTEFCRRILPTPLKPYYAESRLDNGKDDEILMCEKLLIMDDEFTGKSKREEKRLKAICSKDTFSIREPYGRISSNRKRLAVLAGTSNETLILTDPTGNRRVIPIHILGIDNASYNSIDKDALFMEFYHLYKSGYKWQLTKEDIERLNNCTGNHEATNYERELINMFFELPGKDEVEDGVLVKPMMTTEIKDFIEENSMQKVGNLQKFGAELVRMGFQKKDFRTPKGPRKCYLVKHIKSQNYS